MEPLEDRMRKNNQIMWERYSRLQPNDPRRLLMEGDKKQRLKSRFGWRYTTKPLMEATQQIMRDIPRVTLHPWSSTYVAITAVQLEKKKEEYQKEELKQETSKKIEEINADILVFTDGSTSGEQENWGAGIAIMDRKGSFIHEESHPAGIHCSSYDGECLAMLKAIRWIKEKDEANKNMLLTTRQPLQTRTVERRQAIQ